VLACAQSYVVSSLAPEGWSLDSTLYLVPAGVHGLSVEGSWTAWGCGQCPPPPMMPMTASAVRAPAHRRRRRFPGHADVVLPQFQSGAAAVALALCRAVVAATAAHLKSARFEHLARASERAYRHCVRSSQQIQIDTMASRRASTTWLSTSSGLGIRHCYACSRPKPPRAK